MSKKKLYAENMEKFYFKLKELLDEYNVSIDIVTSHRILAGECSPRLVSEIYISHPDIYYFARIPIDKKDINKKIEKDAYKEVNLLKYVRRFSESYTRHKVEEVSDEIFNH